MTRPDSTVIVEIIPDERRDIKAYVFHHKDENEADIKRLVRAHTDLSDYLRLLKPSLFFTISLPRQTGRILGDMFFVPHAQVPEIQPPFVANEEFVEQCLGGAIKVLTEDETIESEDNFEMWYNDYGTKFIGVYDGKYKEAGLSLRSTRTPVGRKNIY